MIFGNSWLLILMLILGRICNTIYMLTQNQSSITVVGNAAIPAAEIKNPEGESRSENL
jgi:hypothetical protein